jgi:molybdopterin molybdotransferase
MVRLKGFQELTPIDDALARFLKAASPRRLESAMLPTENALNRIAAQNITAERSLPPFNRSAVDGYAVKAKNTVDATQFKPKTLRLVETAGIADGEATEIWTGNKVPDGADAVIMLEHTTKMDKEIAVLGPLTPGANVSQKGEDVRKGSVAVQRGTRLRPQHLGLLAALGKARVPVVRQPKVALLATGNELAALDEQLAPYAIVEVNSILLSGMCTDLGAAAVKLGIASDDEAMIETKIREGLRKADVVITTGGTSVGACDLVPKAIEHIEPEGIIVHGIAMRPAMPTALAVVRKKPLLVLSGNPVAAMLGFEVFARPLILRLLGANEDRAKVTAKLTRRVAGVLGRRIFLRARVVERDGEFLAEPVRVKGSGIITTMTAANGYVIIPEDREGLRENEVVTVHLFDAISGEETPNV